MSAIGRTLAVARRMLLESLRDPAILAFSFLLPLFMLGIAWAGSSPAPLPAARKLLLVDDGSLPALRPRLEASLRGFEFPDGRKAISLAVLEGGELAGAESAAKPASAAVEAVPGARKPALAAAEAALAANRADCALILEAGRATIAGDAVKPGFIALSGYAARALGAAAGGDTAEPFVAEPLATAPRSEYQGYAPGMMVFAFAMLIAQAALLSGRDMRKGLFSRLFMTRLSLGEYSAGLCITLSATALVQYAIALAFAAATGAGLAEQPLAPVPALVLFAVGSTGIGVAVAALAGSDSAALNTGSTVAMVQVFLSGSFFPFNDPVALPFLGRAWGVSDLMPATHVFRALKLGLLGGEGGERMLPQLACLAILAAASIGAARAAMRRKIMRSPAS